MSDTVLVQKVDDVRIEHTGVLFTVQAKGTHNQGATNARLAPMTPEYPEVLELGLYVDQGFTDPLTPVKASLEFEPGRFAEVCVRGATNRECRPVFEKR
jgi:hypothetical protein